MQSKNHKPKPTPINVNRINRKHLTSYSKIHTRLILDSIAITADANAVFLFINLFPHSPDSLKDLETTSYGNFSVLEGNLLSHKGFLYKKYPISAISSTGVGPPTERKEFEELSEGVHHSLHFLS